MTAPMFQPNGWPLTDIPPGELRGMARMRDEFGAEASAAGDYRGDIGPAARREARAEYARDMAREAAQ